MKEYEQFAKENSFSPIRFAGLSSTLDSLSRLGTCFVVRIPVHPMMKKIEERWMPDFDNRIGELAASHSLRYLNYINLSDEFPTTDGNHLTRKAALRFTGMLSTDIAMGLRSQKMTEQ
jgi:hypothetical protein